MYTQYILDNLHVSRLCTTLQMSERNNSNVEYAETNNKIKSAQ